MSTIKEIANSTTTIFVNPKEPLLLSLLRDAGTFGFLLLCIYVSHGSAWWTFLTGTMFIVFIAGKTTGEMTRRGKTFNTPQEAIAYLQKQGEGE